MDGLGSAASVVAVIDLSAKVASLCFQYYSAVKNAKSDIERLHGGLGRLNITLEGVRELLESPNGARLLTSQRLWDGLCGCSSQLTELETKLEKELNPGTVGRMMSRLGAPALKWPFESKDVERIIKTIEQFQDTVSAALTIDQTYIVASLLGFLKLTLDIVCRSLISVRISSFPNCRPQAAQLSTRTPVNTTRDVIQEPELLFARK
jgi:hypothetical protein